MQEERNRSGKEPQQPYNEQVARGEAGGIINEYIVEEKDTLPDIARRYGVSIEEIMAANEHISEPADMVQPGLRIMIPKKM
jgi:nucleoid-associated protein YgaU